MKAQARTAKVLVSLVASMTLGAFVLMALDNHSLSAGAFSLASYTHLNPVEQATTSNVTLDKYNWDCIEVSYSNTTGGNLDDLANLSGLTSGKDVNYHFVIYNGNGTIDGMILATDRWKHQRPCLIGGDWYGSTQTIRICVISDGQQQTPLTDCQISRTASLVESLSRKFDVSTQYISYPLDWQM